jgi:hypothetical protein
MPGRLEAQLPLHILDLGESDSREYQGAAIATRAYELAYDARCVYAADARCTEGAGWQNRSGFAPSCSQIGETEPDEGSATQFESKRVNGLRHK